MRTNPSGWNGFPAAVLLGILLVAGALLGSCSAAAVALEGPTAALSALPDGGHDPACAHAGPTAEVAVTEPLRRGDGAGTDGMAALPGVPGLAPLVAGLRAARATGTRGPPVAGRVLLESLGIARI